MTRAVRIVLFAACSHADPPLREKPRRDQLALIPRRHEAVRWFARDEAPLELGATP